MSKSSKSSAKSPAKRVAKKPLAQVKKAKKPMAKAKVKKVGKTVEPVAKRGFMWKLLENKEKQLKEQSQKNATNPFARHESEAKPNERHHAFNKFAGPRRRVG